MADTIRVAIDLAAKQAQAEAKKLAAELDGAADAADDVESAGRRMASAINASADDMIAEIDDTARAVKALDDALERAGGKSLDVDTRDVVKQLKAAGLTADDVTADADELAAALKRIDDVKITAANKGFADVDQALGRTTDNSRVASTAIGGIGNSISELPGVGSLGPVAESMGMLAENALEGEANLKGLVVAGGGLAALGLAMGVISSAMQSMADTDAFNQEQVASFRDLVNETADGLAAINEHFREAEEIAGRAGGMGPFFEKTKDITDQLIDAGVTYDEFITGVEQGGDAIDLVTGKLKAHRDALRDEMIQKQRSNESTAGYEEAISELDDAIEIATETHKNYAGAVGEQSRWDEWTRQSTIAKTEAVSALTAQLRAVPGLTIAEVDADTAEAGAQLDDLIRKLRAIGSSATVASVVAANRFRQFARGTQYAPGGVALVGEEGPELVDLPTGSRVTPAAETAAMLDAGRGAGNVYNSTTIVNMPAGARPDDVVAARRRYGQTQGTEF